MNYLKIKKTGIYAYKYDEEKQKVIGRRIKRNRILTALRSSCKIDKDVLLIDLINHVEYYKDLKKVIKYYSWCSSMDELNEEAASPLIKESTSGDIRYLVVSRSGDVFEYKGKEELSFSLDFMGMGFDEEGKESSFSVSYCPMNEIAHLPIVLDEKVEIRKNYKEKVLISTMDLSLLDILDAIYWDISFVGGPEQKKDFLEEMRGRLEDLGETDCEVKDFLEDNPD